MIVNTPTSQTYPDISTGQAQLNGKHAARQHLPRSCNPFIKCPVLGAAWVMGYETEMNEWSDSCDSCTKFL